MLSIQVVRGLPRLALFLALSRAAMMTAPQQDAVGNGRLRPGVATWRTGRNIRVVFDSGSFTPLREK